MSGQVGIDPCQRPRQEILRRVLGGKHVQHCQDFLNARQPRAAVIADGRKTGGVRAVAISRPMAVASDGGADALPRSRAVEQQINRPTVFVAKSHSHKSPKAWRA